MERPDAGQSRHLHQAGWAGRAHPAHHQPHAGTIRQHGRRMARRSRSCGGCRTATRRSTSWSCRRLDTRRSDASAPSASGPRTSAPRLSWTPDGHWVAIGVDAPAESRGIWLLSRDGRESTPPDDNVAAREFFSDFNPVFSSDGRHMAFIRPAGVGASAIHILALSPAFEPIGSPVPGHDAVGSPAPRSSRGQATMRRWCSRPALRDSHDCSASPAIGSTGRRSGPQRCLPFGGQATNLSLSRGGRLVYVGAVQG